MYVLFNLPEHLKHFHNYSNLCYVNISFTIENVKKCRMSFLNLNVIREKRKFTTSTYRKPTFCKTYTHFDSFLPTTNKIGMIDKLL